MRTDTAAGISLSTRDGDNHGILPTHGLHGDMSRGCELTRWSNARANCRAGIRTRISALLLSLFGVPLRICQVVVSRLIVAVQLGLSLTQLIRSPHPASNIILYLFFLACLFAGSVVSDCERLRKLNSTLTTCVRWTAFALLVCALAVLVGNGYPANPLAAIDLVRLMRDPLLGLSVCGVAFLMAVIIPLRQDTRDVHPEERV